MITASNSDNNHRPTSSDHSLLASLVVHNVSLC